MQATAAQKVQILQVLYDYCAGQLHAAATAVREDDAVQDCENDSGTWEGHASDASDILQIAIAFAEHGDMQQMLQGVNAHDTLVREDVYEGLTDCDAWGVLQTLAACYYS